LKTGSILILLTSIILTVFLVKTWFGLPETPAINNSIETTSPVWIKTDIPAKLDMNIFVSAADKNQKSIGILARRFRLAGTFFVYNSKDNNSRKAILDDLKAATQHIVSEDDQIGSVKVIQVFRNRIVLRDKTHQEELWMSFSKYGDTDSQEGDSSKLAEADNDAGGKITNRFGVRKVGKQRWLLNRNKLMDYYQELMDDPERLVQVFDSLKPLYNEESKITGYQLGVEGESEFFDAVGFKEGDVVRSVNSIPMENRRRAEYFIKEFVNDRSNAFVLKIERNGIEQKFVYQVR
jgi:type II secretory pathway component PulC